MERDSVISCLVLREGPTVSDSRHIGLYTGTQAEDIVAHSACRRMESGGR